MLQGSLGEERQNSIIKNFIMLPDLCFSFSKTYYKMSLSFTSWIINWTLWRRGKICYVQYFHYNVVLLVFGIKHFSLVIWSSLSFLVPLHYHLCFNKWNEKPSKVSAKTLRRSIPSYPHIHPANIYWTETKCQIRSSITGNKERTKSRYPNAKAGWNCRGESGLTKPSVVM